VEESIVSYAIQPEYSRGGIFAFGQDDCAPRPCPGQEVWDASICACTCPPGLLSTGIVGECTATGARPAAAGAGDNLYWWLALGGAGVLAFMALR
jgi:hypothetical protein